MTYFDPPAGNAAAFLNWSVLTMSLQPVGEGLGRLFGQLIGRIGAAALGGWLGRTASQSTVTLFHAVSEEEFEQVLRTGAFQAAENSVGGKFFAETAADATKWGDRLQGPGNFQVLRVELPRDAADSLMRWERLDGIGPARYGELNQVNVPGMKVSGQ